jgi:hypothetical protein
MNQRWLASCLFLLLAASLPAKFAYAEDESCSATISIPGDVSLLLTLKDGRSVYHQGEIIPLQLAFTSSTEKKYNLNTRNYDRSGRLNAESFCIDPDASHDPLADYYSSGLFGFIGGGLGSEHSLDQTPYLVNLELNEWQSLPPGSYTLRVVSHRIGVAAAANEPGSGMKLVPLASNTVQFQVIAATPEWQAEQLATAVSVLENPGSSDEQTAHAARVLRFLGSEAAARELTRRFWAQNDQPHGWDFMFGLVASPYRATAIEGLKAAVANPQHPVTRELVQTLALLQIQSNPEYRLPPYDEKRKDAWVKQRDAKMAAYNKIVSEEFSLVAATLDSKSGQARAVTVNTLLTEGSDLPEAAHAQLRHLLVASWDSLPQKKRNELIQYRWDEIGGPELLPILRGIVNSPPKPGQSTESAERGPALRHLYELDPTEGRELILREILNTKGDIGISVLGMLPDKELPQVEAPILARLQVHNDTSADFRLIERYATARPLPELKTIYEQAQGKWACDPQAALLRYFLRVDPDYGIAEASAALKERQFTGCYKMVFSDFRDALRLPGLEKIAISALNDPSPEVAANAAGALGKYGSAKAEPALWQRLRKFHEDWGEKSDQLRYRPGLSQELLAEGMLEYSLIHAIANGQAWLCGPEKLQRLAESVTTERKQEVEGMIKEWQNDQFFLNMNWWPTGELDYTVAYFSGHGMADLTEKLSQFPSGTRFTSIMTIAQRNLHRAEVAEVENAAAAAGLRLEIQTPR